MIKIKQTRKFFDWMGQEIAEEQQWVRLSSVINAYPSVEQLTLESSTVLGEATRRMVR